MEVRLIPIADERVGVQVNCEIPLEHVPHLSASAVVIHYEEALYQVYAPLPLYGLLLVPSFRRWLQLQFDFDSIAVRIPFDCSSTALRPFDDLRYYRNLCVG